MSYKVVQLEPYVGEEELCNLKTVIQTGWLTEGPFAKEFIDQVKEFTGAKHALLVNNGTLALYLVMVAMGIKAGDEVIVPDFTFSASASSIVFTGATPKLIDIDPSDLNLDVTKLEALITPQTKAIMPVHVYGRSCDMDPILAIAKKYNLKVIEDAAQGYGVFYKGKHVGTLGDVGTISFFADKTLTMGEGGIILTNDDALFEKMKLVRNQGRSNSGTFVHPALGMNFRLTDLQCAVGCAQLKKFKKMEQIKLSHYEMYRSLLGNMAEITFVGGYDYSNFVPFRVNIRVPLLSDLLPFLEGRGIQTRQFFYPLHRQPYLSYLNHKEEEFPVSNKANQEGLSLPVFCNLKEEQIRYICDNIKEFYSA